MLAVITVHYNLCTSDSTLSTQFAGKVSLISSKVYCGIAHTLHHTNSTVIECLQSVFSCPSSYGMVEAPALETFQRAINLGIKIQDPRDRNGCTLPIAASSRACSCWYCPFKRPSQNAPPGGPAGTASSSTTASAIQDRIWSS